MNELVRELAPEPDWDQLRPVLDDAMHDLGEKDRLAVLLRYFQNESLRDVGAALGLSENAARMKVDKEIDSLLSVGLIATSINGGGGGGNSSGTAQGGGSGFAGGGFRGGSVGGGGNWSAMTNANGDVIGFGRGGVGGGAGGGGGFGGGIGGRRNMKQQPN